jgi:CRP-like cAMP-binding protein
MNAPTANPAESLPDLVARSALMRGTTDAALEQLRRARLQLRALASGECVFRPGDAVDAVYLLLGARARSDGLDVDPLVQLELKPDTGKRGLRFERIVHGEIFGELELLEQGLVPKGATHPHRLATASHRAQAAARQEPCLSRSPACRLAGRACSG